MKKRHSAKRRRWEGPKFEKNGMNQWLWRVLHRENFKLGRNVKIGTFTIIDAHKGVEIQDNVEISFGCVILSYSSIDKKGGKVILKENCKIGANSVIMPGIKIGRNAVIGALSFVNQDIPADEVWAGTPAKFIKNIILKNQGD